MFILNQAIYKEHSKGDLLSSDLTGPPIPAGLLDHFWEDYQDLKSHDQLLSSLIKASNGTAEVGMVTGGYLWMMMMMMIVMAWGEAVIILARWRYLDDDDGDDDDDDAADDDNSSNDDVSDDYADGGGGMG